MYSSFFERVFGFSSSTAPSSTAKTEASEADRGSAAPRLGTSDSTQNRATTRPYHCSQNQLSRTRSPGSCRNDSDGATITTTAAAAVERSINASVTSLVSRLTSSSSATTTKSPKLTFAVPRSAAEGSGPVHSPMGPAVNPSRLSTRTGSGSSLALDAMSTASTGGLVSPSTSTASSGEHVKRFEAALRAEPVDVAALRELSWQGCPVHLRYEVWMFLTGCWSAQTATRLPTVSRRRIEYATYIHSSYGIVDWDAVCAMVDSGVDTAVRRSTLKTVEPAASTPGASFASLPLGPAASLGDVAPPELVITCSTPRASEHGSPVLSAVAAEKSSGAGAREVVSGELHLTKSSGSFPAASASAQLRSGSSGLRRSAVSLEDVRSLLTQSQNPTSPISALEASNSVAAATATSEVSGNSASAFTAGKWQLSASLQLPTASAPGSDVRFSSTPTKPLTAPTSAATTTPISHQLSASTMLGSKELQTLKQIRKDIPRMSGGRCYLRHPRVQGSIERILFIWSLRHPACGYVQGMNDLVVPFTAVVLAHHFCPTRSITELHSYTEDIFEEIWAMEAVPVTQWINEIEAEVYWLTSYLLNTMQDNYTSSHEGITAMMRHLAAVVRAADPPLYHHVVDTLQIQFEHFSFRWMNCLLLRELTETQSLRLLDAYLSDEERRWSLTHVYVCAALLLRWGPQLLGFGSDYISALKFLQSPPTEQMSLRDFQDVLSESFVLQNLYEASLTRLAPSSSK